MDNSSESILIKAFDGALEKLKATYTISTQAMDASYWVEKDKLDRMIAAVEERYDQGSTFSLNKLGISHCVCEQSRSFETGYRKTSSVGCLSQKSDRLKKYRVTLKQLENAYVTELSTIKKSNADLAESWDFQRKIAFEKYCADVLECQKKYQDKLSNKPSPPQVKKIREWIIAPCLGLVFNRTLIYFQSGPTVAQFKVAHEGGKQNVRLGGFITGIGIDQKVSRHLFVGLGYSLHLVSKENPQRRPQDQACFPQRFFPVRLKILGRSNQMTAGII